MIERINNYKAGGILLDGSGRNYEVLCLTVTQPPGITSFLTVSAAKGETQNLDRIYRLASVAKDKETRQRLHSDLDSFFGRHEIMLDTYLGYGRLSATQKANAREKSRDSMSLLRTEARAILERVFHEDDSYGSSQAHLQSFGERTNLLCVLRPALAARGFLPIHLDALGGHMVFHPSPEGKMIDATINRDPSVSAIAESLRSYMAAKPASNSHEGKVFLLEGFIGRVGKQIVTSGYDGSDQTSLVGAEAIYRAGYSDTPTATLIKFVDGDIPANSLEELDEYLRRQIGSGRLVGKQAMEYAIRYGITIIIRDINTGREYIFAPKRA